MNRTSTTTIVLIISFVLCGCREEIIHNVSEYEANRLLSSLHDMSIDAAKERTAEGTWAISVPSSEALRSIKFVSDSRMVREPISITANKSSLVMSRDEQRFAYERGLSREIETTLLSVPGVLEARVHLNIPATDPLLERRNEQQKGSASVLLLIESRRLVARDEIASLVSGASGISVSAVSVVVAVDAHAVGSMEPRQGLTGFDSDGVTKDAHVAATSPLFIPDAGYVAADAQTSISVERKQFAQPSIPQRLKHFFISWGANLSPLRAVTVSTLLATLLGLYLYARRIQNGTGIKQGKNI